MTRPATKTAQKGKDTRPAPIAPEIASQPGVQYFGKDGRRLKHPRADWISDPAAFGLPPYRAEFRFHPSRQWRFDFAWPEHRLALEIDGGSGGFGRHSRPSGMRGDNEKINAATLLGWRVLRVLRGEEVRLSTLDVIRAGIALAADDPGVAA